MLNTTERNDEGRFPDHLTVRAPIGMREQVRAAAGVAQEWPAEFMRRAIERRIAEMRDAEQDGQSTALALAG
jgi:hypothetical protein